MIAIQAICWFNKPCSWDRSNLWKNEAPNIGPTTYQIMNMAHEFQSFRNKNLLTSYFPIQDW